MPKACVIGLGRSGIAAARLLTQQGWAVTVSDSGTSEALQALRQTLEADGIQVKLGDRFQPTADLQRIVVSPGVRWDLPALVHARDMGIETVGEMGLAWDAMTHIPWVGITGTNGKTTTTALIEAIFKTAGLHAPACGNIGYAACEVALSTLNVPANEQPDWIIAEVSSYQVESSPQLAPRIGLWTTFTPDHLARHYTLENYHAIKAHLLQQSHHAIFNGDDPYLRSQATRWPQAHWTSVEGKRQLLGAPDDGAYVEDGWAIALGDPIVPVGALKMVGTHNHQNLLMAVLAARLAGIEPRAIARAVEEFPGVAHRLELVQTWQGIRFINDSKATNYDAAQVGLASVEAPAILIAGGEAKEGDDTAWLNTIQQKAAAVLLIGNAAEQFAQRLQAIGYTQYEIVETMDRAVARGAELAQTTQATCVLLSPACASFDQYTSFEHRGDDFRQCCHRHLSDTRH
ncbi:UDP-N-acetylmuramoyl-L-alanine--D-glutamate ligase [Leptolyngbya sp. AN02str]|uniref:UDP-N-acetylmuramoyl-L-alanine--D-glutamate ligase n=1 Tax=Leptolyngbya sp. AN02str TaxID=3423363 RepID=UPI003D322B00